MVDLRPPDAAVEPSLRLQVSEAAEQLRLVGVLVDEVDHESYDLGTHRLEQLRGVIEPGRLAELRAEHGSSKTFHTLALLAAHLPSPADAATLTRYLEERPAATWHALLGHHAGGHHGVGDAELGDRVAAGDEDAVEMVREWADDDACPGAIRDLLAMEPEQHSRLVLLALDAIGPAWDAIGAEAMAAIERDARHRAEQLEAGMPVRDIVVDATNGYALPTDVALSEVVLLPSYVLRPWIVIARHGRAEVLSSVVADQFVGLPSEAPSPALLKLFKALSDEGRLRLLRRMSDGPISLTEACEELDVAKATAHHHLSTLRQAGLVVIEGEGRGKRYALRDDPPEAARMALAEYVSPRR